MRAARDSDGEARWTAEGPDATAAAGQAAAPKAAGEQASSAGATASTLDADESLRLFLDEAGHLSPLRLREERAAEDSGAAESSGLEGPLENVKQQSPARRHGNLYELGVCRTAACAPCHRSRVRCVFAKNARACVQCTRRGDQCVPRVVVRKGETLGELRVQSGKWPPLLLAGRGSPGEQFQAVRQLIKLSKALGRKQPPARLHYLCAHMFLAARELHSMPRLHAATCLAAALGIDSPMEWLDRPPRAASAEAVARVSEEVHARVLVAPYDGASFVVRSNAGHNEVLVNSTFESLFMSATVLAGHISAGKVPEVETWPNFVVSPEDVHDFMGDMVEAIIRGHTTAEGQSGQPGHSPAAREPWPELGQPDEAKRSWSCTMSRRVEVRDASKALFEATLSAAGSFGEGGVCYAVGVCFHRLRPLNDAATLRWQAMCGSTSPVAPPYRANTDTAVVDDVTFSEWMLDASGLLNAAGSTPSAPEDTESPFAHHERDSRNQSHSH